MSISESIPPPINKRCRSCREVKLLMDFDFSQRSKDKRAQTCKECKAQKQHHDQICTCGCTSCQDGRVVGSAYYLMESVLSRCYEGMQVPNQFRELIVELAATLLDEDS